MDLKSSKTILTPAKVNFFLNIIKKREDGHHELILDLIPISLFDRISFSPSNKPGIKLISPDIPIQSEDNLVVKAARLLESASGLNFSLLIHLSKNIPSGAGLGGGSGNAAGTLVTINHLLGLNLSKETLVSLALELGADVPFFIQPKPSVAQGMGEQLSDLPPFQPLPLLILFPGFSISTREAYSQCSITERTQVRSNYSREGFRNHSPELNDFWTLWKERYGALDMARKALMASGAITAGLSGSGSALYAVFDNESIRDHACEALKNRNNWQLFPCQTISHYKYW